MRPCTKLSHGAEVLFLSWCEPIKTNPEEALIKSGYGLASGALYVHLRDGALLCHIPRMLTPLLKEIGIAPGLIHNKPHSLGFELDTLVISRLYDSYCRFSLAQRANFRVVEKPLCIGLCVTSSPAQLRQASTYHSHWQPALSAPMESRD